MTVNIGANLAIDRILNTPLQEYLLNIPEAEQTPLVTPPPQGRANPILGRYKKPFRTQPQPGTPLEEGVPPEPINVTVDLEGEEKELTVLPDGAVLMDNYVVGQIDFKSGQFKPTETPLGQRVLAAGLKYADIALTDYSSYGDDRTGYSWWTYSTQRINY